MLVGTGASSLRERNVWDGLVGFGPIFASTGLCVFECDIRGKPVFENRIDGLARLGPEQEDPHWSYGSREKFGVDAS